MRTYSPGATAGLPPECFEEAFYIRIHGYERKLLHAVKAIKMVFQVSLSEALRWVRDEPMPFTLPLGPFPLSEATWMVEKLRKGGLVVTLVPGEDRLIV